MKLVCVLFCVAFLSCTSHVAKAQTVTCGEKCAKVLGLTNKIRVAQGLNKLCLNSKLMETAEMHNNYQTLTNTMTHVGPNGQTLGDRVLLNNYKFKKANENVAKGMTSAKTAMNGWLNSETHRDNLLTSNVHMGVAFNLKSKTWTQVFGTPMDEDDETCDITTKYGKWGTTSSSAAKAATPRSGCGRKCNRVLELLNQNRAKVGVHSLCLSPQLMAAAEDLILMQIGKKSKIPGEEVISSTGYSWKKYATLDFKLSSNRRGAIPNNEILRVLEKEINRELDRSISPLYSQIGFSGSNDGRYFKLVFASTWDINTDKCQDGSSPHDTGVDAKHGKSLDNENHDHSPSKGIAKAFGVKADPSKYTSRPTKRSEFKSDTLAIAYGDMAFPADHRLNPVSEPPKPMRTVRAPSSPTPSPKDQLEKFVARYMAQLKNSPSSDSSSSSSSSGSRSSSSGSSGSRSSSSGSSGSRSSSSGSSGSRSSSSSTNPWAQYNSRGSYNYRSYFNPFAPQVQQLQGFRQGR